jgi:hypothetical protein
MSLGSCADRASHKQQQLYTHCMHRSLAFTPPTKSRVRNDLMLLLLLLPDLLPHSVSTRLHQYASGKPCQTGSPQSARHSHQRSSSTSPGPTDRWSASNRLSAAATAPPLAPDFYRRQNALLQKRAELAARRRRSSDDDMTECTCEAHAQLSCQPVLLRC